MLIRTSLLVRTCWLPSSWLAADRVTGVHLSEQATCTTTDRCSVLLLAVLPSSVWLLCCCASQDVEDLLARAMEKRTVGCTQLNEQSSRSHAVFTLRIEGVNDSSKLKVGLWGFGAVLCTQLTTLRAHAHQWLRYLIPGHVSLGVRTYGSCIQCNVREHLRHALSGLDALLRGLRPAGVSPVLVLLLCMSCRCRVC